MALDDAAPQDAKALGRMVRFVKEHPNALVVVGTHGDTHVPLARTFHEQEIPCTRLFLRPLGRRELRLLVERVMGSPAIEVVERVLEVIHRQGLPRNPLNIAALVSIVTREVDLTALNESGLLQSYVNVLLDNPSVVDAEGLGMDYRRRELLLERLAALLIRHNVTRLPRGDAEAFILEW